MKHGGRVQLQVTGRHPHPAIAGGTLFNDLPLTFSSRLSGRFVAKIANKSGVSDWGSVSLVQLEVNEASYHTSLHCILPG